MIGGHRDKKPKERVYFTGGFSEQEYEILFEKAKEFAFSWVKVARYLPGRDPNYIKTVFNSSMKCIIKKLELFKLLKHSIIWPTYTNKSKPNVGYFFIFFTCFNNSGQEQLYLDKIDGEISNFEENFKEYFKCIKISFQSMNRLSQKIVHFLLESDGSDPVTMIRLIENIFGKLAKGRFLKKGIRKEFLQREKKTLRKFIDEYFKEIDKKKCIVNRENLFFQQNLQEIKELKSNCIIKKKKSKKKQNLIILEEKQLTNTVSPQDSLANLKVDTLHPVLISEFRINNVDEKYINHLEWLYKFSDSTEKIKSFEELVKKAYCLESVANSYEY
jgi:hypothetical protein